MSFVDPRWLWLVLGVPVLILLEGHAHRRARRALEQLVGSRTDSALLAQRLPGRRRTSLVLRALALALLAFGAAGPEWGSELMRRTATGSDVILLIDVSASMDVRDVAPSRLEEARREALAVLDRLAGSKVGVVAFAGDAVRMCPLTLDRSAARLVIESLSSGSVSEPGSDLGRGLRTAARALPGGRRSEQVIVAWTDGEDLEAQANAAIDEIANAGLRVFAVGVGTASGDVVPVLDEQGRAVDVKRDESGGAVRSRLDERLLRTVARRTHGAYFSAARPGGELPRLLSALGSIARGARGERLVERPVPRFAWFAALAAALLAIEIGRARRRREASATRQAQALAAAATLLLLAIGPRAVEAQSPWAKGDAAFRHGRYAEAESLYAKRVGKSGPIGARVNQATARALAGRRPEAESALQGLKQAPGMPGLVAGYNLGTLKAERQAYDEALKELRSVLERDPGHDDARYNYELALRRSQQPPPRPSPQSPRPEPSPGGSQGGGGAPPPSPPPSPGAPQPDRPPPSPQPTEGMTRDRAEQLLGSLEELERLERQRLNRVRVMRERRGRDW